MFLNRSIDHNSHVIIQSHVQNANENTCKMKATALQDHPSNLFFIKGKIRPIMSHVNKVTQKDIKFFPATVVFLKVRYTISKSCSRITLIPKNVMLNIFS